MVAEIIGVSAALTEREALDSAVRLIAKELGACGITVSGGCAVGGDVHRLRGAIAHALERSDIVILLGGLGASEDCITKETVCAGLGKRLVLHEGSLRRIKEAYERAGRQMPQQAAKLAMLPEQSVVFPGVRGISPGCALSAGRQFIIMIPENPQEFVPMFQRSVVPYLAKFSEAAVVTHTVNVFGIPEQEAAALLGDLMLSENPAVAVYPKQGELQIRVTARAGTKQEASSMCSPAVREIEQRLGGAVYGVDQPDLQTAVVNRLNEALMQIAVGESGTGSMLGDMLTVAPGSGQVFRFGVSAYADRVKLDALKVSQKLLKKYGTVSEQTAAAMAYGAMKQGRASYGAAVTGFFGGRDDNPKKTGLVYVAVCDARHVWVKRLALSKELSSDQMRSLACLHVLNLVRLCLDALPSTYAGANSIDAAATGGKLMLAGEAAVPEKAGKSSGNAKEPPAAKKQSFLSRIFPVKGDSGTDIVRKMILIVAVLVFLCSIGYLVYFYSESASNRNLNDGLAQEYIEAVGGDSAALDKIELPEGYPEGYQKKFANLYKINNDIAGWIKIEGTQVNYPIVQYMDNDYYLRRDFYRNNNKHGIPWLDYHDKMNPQSANYVIYGHNMTDGQMFGELMKYKGESGLAFLQEHPIISMDDVYRDNQYKIFSVFITNVDTSYGEVFYYNTYTDFKDDAEFNWYVEESRARSFYDSDVDVKPGDQLLTLSTCSYEYGPVADTDTRTVIVARRVRDGEKADGSDITYTHNPDYKLPPGFSRDNVKAANATVTNPPSSVPQTAPQSSSAAPSSKAPSSQAPASSKPVPSSAAPTPPASTPAPTPAPAPTPPASSAPPPVSSAPPPAPSAPPPAPESSSSEDEIIIDLEGGGNDELEAEYEGDGDDGDGLTIQTTSVLSASTSRSEDEGETYEPEVSVASSSSKKPSSGKKPSSSQGDGADKEESANEKPSSGSKEKLSVISNGKKVTGSASEIVSGIVMNEMGPSFEEEALKAQAVAVYTYVMHQNQSGVTPYLGMKTPSGGVENAVKAVAGEAVYYRGDFAFTPFYATSAGVTAASRDVWGGSYPYLVSVDSEIDEQARNYEVTVNMDADDVAKKVKKSLKVDLYDYSDNPEDWFEIESYTDGDRYVDSVRVGNKTTTGRILREQVLGLRSTAFEIDYDSGADKFTFTTYGYGHGVGMSQTGANLYVQEEGWTYTDILEHYYPGCSVR